MATKHGGSGGGRDGGSTMQMRRPFVRASASALLLFCFAGSGSDAIYSDVEISNFDQSALELSFRVSWKTVGGGGGEGGSDSNSSASATTASAASAASTGSSDKVDVWLLTRQPNPSSWMETVLMEVG